MSKSDIDNLGKTVSTESLSQMKINADCFLLCTGYFKLAKKRQLPKKPNFNNYDWRTLENYK